MKLIEKELLDIIPDMRVFARSRSHDQSDADDLVQKTIVRMLEKEHLFMGGKLIAWAITIMKNIIIDEARSTKGRLFTNIDDEYLCNSDDNSPEKVDDINMALQQLTDKCREVLVLFGFGYSYEEISVSLSIEKGTVMSRLSRCRQQLIQVLN